MHMPIANRLTVNWPERHAPRALTLGLRVVGAVLLVFVGLIHLSLAPDYYLQAQYIGVLFYVNCVASWLTAALILVGIRGVWILGALIAAGAGVALTVAATVGLPSFTDMFSAPHAEQSLVVEALFLVTYAVGVATRRSPLGA